MTAKRWAAVGVALFLLLAGGGYFAAGLTAAHGPARALLIVCGLGLIAGAVYAVRHAWGQTGEGGQG